MTMRVNAVIISKMAGSSDSAVISTRTCKRQGVGLAATRTALDREGGQTDIRCAHMRHGEGDHRHAAGSRACNLRDPADHLPRLRAQQGLERGAIKRRGRRGRRGQRLGEYMQRADLAGGHADQQLGRAHLQQHGPFLGSQAHFGDDTHRAKAAAAQVAHAPREPGAQEDGAEHDAQRERDLAHSRDTGHRDTGDGPGGREDVGNRRRYSFNAACGCARRD